MSKSQSLDTQSCISGTIILKFDSTPYAAQTIPYDWLHGNYAARAAVAPNTPRQARRKPMKGMKLTVNAGA